MPLKKVTFRPGIVREQTSYTNEGGWFDGDKIRFRAGLPEKIGGWKKAVKNMFLGTCRALHEWMALDSNKFLGLGTHLKYYILWGDAYYDITPIRATTVLPADPFTTAGGGMDGMTPLPAALIVNAPVHKATVHDFITINGVKPPPFDVYTPAMLNGHEFQIIEIIDANTYKINTGFLEGTTAGIHGGGDTVSVEYQVYTGLDVAVPGTGWGASPWGGVVTGTGSSTVKVGWGESYSYETEGNVPVTQIRLWSQDNFGEDLIFNIRNGTVFYWSRKQGMAHRGVPLASMPAQVEAPLMAFEIMLSEVDRHVIAIGTNEIGLDYIDPLMVRWSSQENPFDWEPRRDNTAGGQRLSSGSSVAGALRTRQEILIWTEKNLQSMRFQGAPYIFGFNLIAENVSVLSPNAMINAGGRVWWMDRNTFYQYSGQVQELPCTVRDYVFSDFNMQQRMKVCAGHNHNFQEVLWFYPSAKSQEIDKYVMYNYVENTWAYGLLVRTAWLDLVWGGSYPVATANGILYHHEYGDDADTEPLTAWIESSDIDLEDGDRFVFLRRVIPDIVFRGKGDTQSVGVTLRARRAPGDFYTEKPRATVTPYTKDVWARARGRQFSMRIESEAFGTGWRLGAFRIDMQPDGKR